MSCLNIISGPVPSGDVILDRNEAAIRLSVPRGFSLDQYNNYLDDIRNEACCRYSAVKVPVSFDSGKIHLANIIINSKDLTKNLNGCSYAFVLAVTLGIGIDRLLAKKSLTSQSDFFIYDALSSAFAESLCNTVDDHLTSGLNCNPRFSPGYGDLDLKIQPEILELLNAQKLLGITLNKSLLMTPVKSITAIKGIKNEN